MIGRLVRKNSQGTVPQIDLLVALGSLRAVGAPSLSHLFLELLGFVALKVICKKQSPLLLGKGNPAHQQEAS